MDYFFSLKSAKIRHVLQHDSFPKKLYRSYSIPKNEHHWKYQFHCHVLDFCAAHRVINLENNSSFFWNWFPGDQTHKNNKTAKQNMKILQNKTSKPFLSPPFFKHFHGMKKKNKPKDCVAFLFSVKHNYCEKIVAKYFES